MLKHVFDSRSALDSKKQSRTGVINITNPNFMHYFFFGKSLKIIIDFCIKFGLPKMGPM